MDSTSVKFDGSTRKLYLEIHMTPDFQENGDCREVLSERQGPLRMGLLLSTDCEPSFGVHNDR